ncbi:MAG: PAS domain-containing protein [Verrucomicrobiia bacterium]
MLSFFYSLRIRVLLVVALGIVPALGLVFYTGLMQRRMAEDNAKQLALQLAQGTARQYKFLVEHSRGFLVDLVQRPEIRGDAATGTTLCTNLLKSHPEYNNIGVLGLDGSILFTALGAPRSVNVSDRLYFQQVLETRDFSTGNYQIGRITHKGQLHFGYPVPDATGGVQAVAFCAVELDWLGRLLAEVRLPENSTLTLFDAKGMILVRHPEPEKWVGRAMPDKSVVKTILSSTTEDTDIGFGVDGVQRLYGFIPLSMGSKATRIYVAVGIPTTLAFAEPNKITKQNMLCLAIIALLAIFVARVVADKFVLQPIQALAKATRRLAGGDLSARAAVRGRRGELGQLAGAFDEMAEALEKRRIESQQTQATLASERNLLRLLIDTFPDLIYVKDTEGRFLLGNEAVARVMAAVSPDELIGKTDFDYYPKELADRFYADDRQVLTSGTPLKDREEHYTSCGGPAGWYLTTKVPIRDANGNITGLVGISRDITARKQAAEALRRERDLIMRIMETSPEGVIMADPQGRITYANARAEQVLGLTKDEILQRAYNAPEWQITDHEGRPFPEEKLPFARVVATRQPVTDVRYAIERSDGQRVLLSANGAPLLDQDGEVDGVVLTVEDITAHVRADEELYRSREMLQYILNNIPQRVFWKDRDSVYLGCNKLLALDAGLTSPEAIIGKNDFELSWKETAQLYRADDKEVMETGTPKIGYEEPQSRPGGLALWLRTSKAPLHDRDGKVIGVLGTYEDITERQQLEDELRQAQKMEAVGRLAGGIAHDFNNMLTAILGFSELTLQQLPADSPLRRHVEQINSAAKHTQLLTRQLLTFSRKQVTQPQLLALNTLVSDTGKMLQHLIGEDIELQILPGTEPDMVRVDPGQIEQIIMNLAVNARDAMPHGGKLIIQTGIAVLDETYLKRHPGAVLGNYATLSISDTGYGMTSEVKAHLFEPFFTTKPSGMGTGLGLATSYGIVKQAGGYISAYSEAGRGTTFVIYLPLVEEGAETQTPEPTTPKLLGGTETILLVEDEAVVREMVGMVLRELGYTVHEAANGEEALLVIEQTGKQNIDLLITDLVMPRMGGKELAARMQASHPKTKILFISGYTGELVISQGELDPGTDFLQKPFVPSVLARKVREILGGRKRNRH